MDRPLLELDHAMRSLTAAVGRLPGVIYRTEAAPAAPAKTPRPFLDDARRALDRVKNQAVRQVYAARIDELEIESELRTSLSSAEIVRALSRRLWPVGASTFGDKSLAEIARCILERTTVAAEAERSVSAEDACVAFRNLIQALGIEVEVRIEPRLVARAATGERTVFLAPGMFDGQELRRLAAHEVLGHALAAANGRTQPLAIFSVGTPESFIDGEGLALFLEEQSSAMDARRLRTIAARVLATDAVHERRARGPFELELVSEFGFDPKDAGVVAERSYRANGMTRDASYLLGWLRVRTAVLSGQASLAELRWGRVSLASLPTLRLWKEEGLVRAPGPHNALRGKEAFERHFPPTDVVPIDVDSLFR